jgi:hypothetical protein
MTGVQERTEGMREDLEKCALAQDASPGIGMQ